MSADKKRGPTKRTHKASGPVMQPVSSRSGDNGVPPEPGQVPQSESQGVAQEDRANTEGQGDGTMSEEKGTGYQPKPSLKDRLGLTKETLIHIGMAVIIAVIIGAVIASQTGVSQSAYNEEQAQQAQSIATQGSEIASNDGDISDLREDFGTINEQYGGVANTVALHTGSINSTTARVGTLEGEVTDIQTELAAVCSPPEAYLTGTVGNYTIHAEASETGNYTASVHLVYSKAFSFNGTYEEAQQYFYTGINWTTGTPYYQTIVSFNGSHWGLAEVWWNIGTFTLTADTEKGIAVLFGGLADTPSFAYVEIYPALK